MEFQLYVRKVETTPKPNWAIFKILILTFNTKHTNLHNLFMKFKVKTFIIVFRNLITAPTKSVRVFEEARRNIV